MDKSQVLLQIQVQLQSLGMSLSDAKNLARILHEECDTSDVMEALGQYELSSDTKLSHWGIRYTAEYKYGRVENQRRIWLMFTEFRGNSGRIAGEAMIPVTPVLI